jgi:photosystem II stability/assembly factor-like uncharacterized protein
MFAMKKIPGLLILCLIFLSCHKNNNSQGNTSSICFDTTFIRTNIPGLESVYFLDGKDGFVSTYNGGIYKTTDSAKTWTSLNSTTTLPIYDIYFTDPQNGFAVGGLHSCGGTGCIVPGGFILRTTNGGQDWTIAYVPVNKIELRSICFLNATTGFCVGDNTILKTINGGQTWTEYRIDDPGGKMMQVKFANALKGYIVCVFDKIIVTEDGGDTWHVTSPNRGIGYYSISEANGVTYVSGQGKIIKSTNGGNTWNELANSPNDIFYIHFTNDQNGFAFGRGNYSGGDFGYNYGSIYCTSNGGNTWDGSRDIKEVGLIQSASFPTATIGYAVSGNTIIRLMLK